MHHGCVDATRASVSPAKPARQTTIGGSACALFLQLESLSNQHHDSLQAGPMAAKAPKTSRIAVRDTAGECVTNMYDTVRVTPCRSSRFLLMSLAPTPPGLPQPATSATAAFVAKSTAAQEEHLGTRWHFAPGVGLLVFLRRVELEAEHSRHDWGVFSGLASALAVVVSLLLVAVEPSQTTVWVAGGAIAGLSALLLIIRLISIRQTQARHIRAKSWAVARGLI